MNRNNPPGTTEAAPALQVIGYYANDESVELTGTASGLHDLADTVSADRPDLTRSLTIPQDTSPAPYDGFLGAVRIVHAEGLVDIKREVDVLVIIGSTENLRILAEDIRFAARELNLSPESHEHIHIEYYPDDGYVAPSALPLVVGREELSE